MATVTAVSGEKVLADLGRCGLLKKEQLQLAQEFVKRNPGVGGRELTDYLVAKNLLGQAQADELWAVYEQRLTLWGYTLIEVLGRGNLGIVYKARGGDGGEYAVKVLPRRNVGNVSRVPQRLQAFLHFQHPSVAPLVHAGTAADRHYLVWPYVADAEPLEAQVRRDGPVAPKHAVHYALQVVRGLRALHDQGLFHGLLNPSNVLVGPGHKAVLVDVGIGFLLTLARDESLLNTLTTSKLLTAFVDFASPESILDVAQRTPRGDQYSLGCVLYSCLTGQVPFPVEPAVKKMMAQQFEEPAPLSDLNPEVPPRLAGVVRRLMKKAPEERFPGMAEVEAALQDLLARPAPPPPPSAATAPPPPRPMPQPVPAAEAPPDPPPAAEVPASPAEEAPAAAAATEAPPAPAVPEAPPAPDQAEAPPVVPSRVVSLQDISLSEGARKAPAGPQPGDGEISSAVWVGLAAGVGILAGIIGCFLFQ